MLSFIGVASVMVSLLSNRNPKTNTQSKRKTTKATREVRAQLWTPEAVPWGPSGKVIHYRQRVVGPHWVPGADNPLGMEGRR